MMECKRKISKHVLVKALIRNSLRNDDFMNPNEVWARELNQVIGFQLMKFWPYTK